MWGSDLASGPNQSAFDSAKLPSDQSGSPSGDQDTASSSRLPAGPGGGSGDEIASVLSHWADARESPRGPVAGVGEPGRPPSPGSESDDGATEDEHDRAAKRHEDEDDSEGSREARNEQALPGIVGAMGKSFSHDFSDVSFTKGLPTAATSHGAQAVAADLNHVALDLNTVDLHSAEGTTILGSELAHIVQKRKGRVEPDAVDAHLEGHAAPHLAARTKQDQQRRDDLEREADNAGAKAAQGARASVQAGARAPKNQFWGLGDIWNKAKKTVSGVVDTAKKGASWVGDKVGKGAAWLGDKIGKGTQWLGDKLKAGGSWLKDKLKKGGSWIGKQAQKGGKWALDKLKKGASWVGGKAKDIYEGVKKKASQTWADMRSGMAQEGVLGFLRDPVGVMDRQRAQHELASRFKIVPNDFVGPRAPNQISQQEFEQVSRTYSNIRLGRGDLTINTDEMPKQQADAFRSGAMNDIANLMQTPSGRAQVMGLSNNVLRDDAGNVRRGIFGKEMPLNLGFPIHRHTTLRALHQDSNGDNDLSNDGNAPLDTTNAVADWGKNESRTYRNADGSRGTGTDVNIRYNPGVTINTTRSDVILMHEMGHTRHETQGTMASGMVDATSGIPVDVNKFNNYEHQAAGLGNYANDPMTENAYRRERTELGDVMPQRTSYSVLP